MRQIIWTIVFVSLLAASSANAQSTIKPPAIDLTGTWSGTVEVVGGPIAVFTTFEVILEVSEQQGNLFHGMLILEESPTISESVTRVFGSIRGTKIVAARRATLMSGKLIENDTIRVDIQGVEGAAQTPSRGEEGLSGPFTAIGIITRQ